MKTFGLRTTTWLRIALSAGLALALLSTLLARAMALPPEEYGAEAPQQTLSATTISHHGLAGDPPDAKTVEWRVQVVALPSPPQLLGLHPRQPFRTMVHQLRDRLMHAPPVYL